MAIVSDSSKFAVERGRNLALAAGRDNATRKIGRGAFASVQNLDLNWLAGGVREHKLHVSFFTFFHRAEYEMSFCSQVTNGADFFFGRCGDGWRLGGLGGLATKCRTKQEEAAISISCLDRLIFK